MTNTLLIALGVTLFVVGYHDAFGWNGEFKPWTPIPTTYTPALMFAGAFLIGRHTDIPLIVKGL